MTASQPSQCDLLLVPFPFSDQSGKKVRPVLVLSKDTYNKVGDDIIVCALTSQLRPSKWSLLIDQHDLVEGVLHEKSMIKVDTILKMHKQLALKKFARLGPTAFSKTRKTFLELF